MDTSVFQHWRKAITLKHGNLSHHLQDDHPWLSPHFWCTNHQSIYSKTSHAAYTMSDYNTAISISSCNNNPVVETADAAMPTPNHQCNSRFPSPTKKRKAEKDVEEKGKEKAIKADESGEGRSEISKKMDRDNSTNTCSKDYIHVRARRGQATDSHSLAERARREKISKKMKCLQELVPGCDRVTGKAGMLDEIINYIQSLQKQVEFLSMKLAALNPWLDLSIDSFSVKECAQLLQASNSSACLLHYYNQMENANCGSKIQSQKAEIISPEGLIDSPAIPQLHLSGWDSEWLNQLFNASFH